MKGINIIQNKSKGSHLIHVIKAPEKLLVITKIHFNIDVNV